MYKKNHRITNVIDLSLKPRKGPMVNIAPCHENAPEGMIKSPLPLRILLDQIDLVITKNAKRLKHRRNPTDPHNVGLDVWTVYQALPVGLDGAALVRGEHEPPAHTQGLPIAVNTPTAPIRTPNA